MVVQQIGIADKPTLDIVKKTTEEIAGNVGGYYKSNELNNTFVSRFFDVPILTELTEILVVEGSGNLYSFTINTRADYFSGARVVLEVDGTNIIDVTFAADGTNVVESIGFHTKGYVYKSGVTTDIDIITGKTIIGAPVSKSTSFSLPFVDNNYLGDGTRVNIAQINKHIHFDSKLTVKVMRPNAGTSNEQIFVKYELEG